MYGIAFHWQRQFFAPGHAPQVPVLQLFGPLQRCQQLGTQQVPQSREQVEQSSPPLQNPSPQYGQAGPVLVQGLPQLSVPVVVPHPPAALQVVAMQQPPLMQRPPGQAVRLGTLGWAQLPLPSQTSLVHGLLSLAQATPEDLLLIAHPPKPSQVELC